jgi:hypothetical protein
VAPPIDKLVEAETRKQIDEKLLAAGWLVQDKTHINLMAAVGVAVRELPTNKGPADYMLFLDGKACGIIESKREGASRSHVAEQSPCYAASNIKHIQRWSANSAPLLFRFEAINHVIRCRDERDPAPRSRNGFHVHKPETIKERRQKWETRQFTLFKARRKVPKDDGWKGNYVEPAQYSGAGYNITGEWLTARAEQVCGLITKGTTTSKDKLSSTSGEIQFTKIYNLSIEVRLNFDLDPTYADLETHKNFLVRSKGYPGDVLMNIVGPPFGKVSTDSGIHDEWNINQAIMIYQPLNRLNNNLLAYFLLAKSVVEWMQRKTKKTAQVNLTLETSRNAQIPIRPGDENAVIVRLIEEKLSSFGRMSSELEVQLTKVKNDKQSILARTFNGGLL